MLYYFIERTDRVKDMTTLYVTDLDGTLLNSDVQISEFTIAAINKMVEEGMLFTYATARSLVSASVVTKGLTTEIPVIAYNGAFIFDAATGKVIASEGFNEPEIQFIKEVAKAFDCNPLVYSFVTGIEKVSYNSNRVNEGVQRYLNSRSGDRRLRPLTDDICLYDGEVFYFTFIGEKEELQSLYDAIKDNESYRVTFQQDIYNDEYWLEIMPVMATKANAILKLKDIMHCDRVVCFGDAINDIPMFQISDECYAVANAVEEVKKIATGVISSNNEDGVAKWLLNMWENKSCGGI